MRIVKEHEERKNEILDTAEALFAAKGYTKTTVSDILGAINIAKGTFYHYFTSKEEVMDAVVNRFIGREIAAAEAIAGNPHLTAHEKMFRIIAGTGGDTEHKDRMVAAAHQVNNAEMHQKGMAASILGLSPILADIVRQGVREGVFTTETPRETVEFLLAASTFLLDDAIFAWQPAEFLEKTKAFSTIMETLLGAEHGSFSYIHARYEEMPRHKSGRGA